MTAALFQRKPAAAPAQPQPQKPTATPPVAAPIAAPLTPPVAPSNGEAFSTLGLRAELVRAVLEHGYHTPTAIQKQAIPTVLEGKDVMGGAQTGTGKTAGFVLPMLQRLMSSPRKGKAPRALVLAPTRELAAQVEESVRVYGKYSGLRSTVIYGGVGMGPQVSALRNGVDIVVACPGRLLDHHSERTIDLRDIEIFVLDEADRMLDMGFIHDVKKVLAALPEKKQSLLFSATFSDEIKTLADKLLHTPALIEVARRNSTVEVVAQSVVMAEKGQKSKLLQQLIKDRQWFQVLVFTRTKHGANRLAEQLSKNEIPALAIHGNKSQNARTKALAEFKSGQLQVLVATDIAARGIDIDQLPHVVNFELPNVPEDYVHRIGRTGRAGATGEALSLVARDELPLLKDIERFTKQTIARVEIEGFVASAANAPGEVDEINLRPPRPAPTAKSQRDQQKRTANTRIANQRRAEQRERNDSGFTNASAKKPSAGGLPAPRVGNPTGHPPKNFQNGNRNTQRGRTR